jgi:Matrixin
MRRLVPLVIALASMVLVSDITRAYLLSGHYWGKSSVNYYINPSNGDMSQQAAISTLQAAAANWSEQTTANIHLVYAGTTSGSSLTNNGKNEVFFRNTSNGSMAGATYFWWGADGKLLDADTVYYDGGFKFFPGSSGCTGGEYLEDIATHEFGHSIGLGHSLLTSATMYPSLYSCSQIWRSLSADDITAVQKAYTGTSSTTTTTSVPAVPAVFRPLNLAINVTTTLLNGSYVRWYAAARATSYDVYFGTSSTPPKIATVVPPAGVSKAYPGTLFQAVTLKSKTTYYWKVVAKNSAGSTSSAVWKFTML